MKTKFIYLIILCLSIVFFNGKTTQVLAENQQKRIKFQISVIGEGLNKREVLTKANIEGLPGTDFRINLNTGNFKMQTRFLTDLISQDELKLRVKLETRRFYGMSPIDLPLYEEDSQKHNLNIGFDKKVILLPFGRNGSSETLKIEIIPTILLVPKNDKDSQILKINFDKKIRSGEIGISASKTPHNFDVETILLADGKEIARGKSDYLLEEKKQITLIPNENAPAEIKNKLLKTNLSVDKFTRGRPKDFASISFDLFAVNQEFVNQKQILSSGRGVSTIGGELKYKVEGLSEGKKYEIKFRVNLSEKEK